MSSNLMSVEARPCRAAGFQQMLAYDVLARMPLVLWFALCGGAMLRHLSADLGSASHVTFALVLEILARVAVIADAALPYRIRPAKKEIVRFVVVRGFLFKSATV